MVGYFGLSEKLAKVGYETMHDTNWDDLPARSIERAMWRKISLAIVKELWQTYIDEQGKLSRE